MWMTILTCLVLVLQGAKALDRKDCTSYDLSPIEAQILKSFCSRENIKAGNKVFANPSNSKTFVVCTDVKTGCSGTCPSGGSFDNAGKVCKKPAPIVCPSPPGANPLIRAQPLDPLINNPCPGAKTKKCFYFAHTTKNRFIICPSSSTINPTVGQCADGFEFSFTDQACKKIGGGKYLICKDVKNPCHPIPEDQKIIKTDDLYFSCLDDPTKFIQCDKWGKMYIKQCKNKTVWSQTNHACGFHTL